MTPYQLGYAATNAETHDEEDALYEQVYDQGYQAVTDFLRGAYDAKMDNRLSEGLVNVGSKFNKRFVSIEQAQYLF